MSRSAVAVANQMTASGVKVASSEATRSASETPPFIVLAIWPRLAAREDGYRLRFFLAPPLPTPLPNTRSKIVSTCLV